MASSWQRARRGARIKTTTGSADGSDDQAQKDSWLSIDAWVRGHAYRLDAQQIKVGVFDGDTGFIGICEKVGLRSLFREFHWDAGAPHGTARPLEDLGPVPKSISIVEWFWIDGNSGQPIFPAGENGRSWSYEDAGERDPEIEPEPVANQELFVWLDDLEVGGSPKPSAKARQGRSRQPDKGEDLSVLAGAFHVSGHLFGGRVYLSLDALRLLGEGATEQEARGALIAEVRAKINLRRTVPRFRRSRFWLERGPVLDRLADLTDEQIGSLLNVQLGDDPGPSLDPSPVQEQRHGRLLRRASADEGVGPGRHEPWDSSTDPR